MRESVSKPSLNSKVQTQAKKKKKKKWIPTIGKLKFSYVKHNFGCYKNVFPHALNHYLLATKCPTA